MCVLNGYSVSMVTVCQYCVLWDFGSLSGWQRAADPARARVSGFAAPHPGALNADLTNAVELEHARDAGSAGV